MKVYPNDPMLAKIREDIEKADAEVVAQIYWHPTNVIGGVANVEEVTRGELKEAFDMVADPDNWKNPIDVRIKNPGPRMMAMIDESVRFFAGCTAHVRPHHDTVHITAKGYYLAIGA